MSDEEENHLKRFVVLAAVAVVAAQLPARSLGRAPTAGSAASRSSLASTSSSRSSGAANIFVSTSGHDSCERSETRIRIQQAGGHTCRSPLRACQIAKSGDRVIIEDGTYDGDFDACRGHQTYRHNVVFSPEPGQQCRITYPRVPAPSSDTSCAVNLDLGGYADNGLDLTGGTSRTCGVTGNPLPSTLTPAQRSTWINHLTIRGMYIGQFSAACAAYIDLDKDAGSAYYIRQGTYHFYIRGGDYGNETDGTQPTIGDTTCGCNDWPPAEDVRIENTVEHDFITQGDQHGDGIFIQPSYDVQVMKNVLARDDCIPIYVNYATTQGQRIGVHGLRIIGNVIHTDTVHNGQGRCNQAISLGDNAQTDTVVAFNSLEGPIRRSNAGGLNADIRIIGNVAGEIDAAGSGDQAACGPGTTAFYNVLTDRFAGTCGNSTNVRAGSQFLSQDAQPNSPSGANKYFTARLGSYLLKQRVKAIKRVPTKWCKTHPGVCPKTDILGRRRPNRMHPSYYDAGAYENR